MLLVEHWLNPQHRSKTKYDAWVLPRVMPMSDGVATLHKTAERIVFAECLPSVLHEMTVNKQIDIKAISQEFKMPTDRLWVEWSIPHGGIPHIKWMRTGCYLEVEPSGKLACVVCVGVMRNDGRCISEMIAACTFASGSIRSGDNMKLEIPAGDAVSKKDIMHAISELVFALFLLGHPKVVQVELAQESPQRARVRRNKKLPPFVEHRKVVLRPGVITRKVRGNTRNVTPAEIDTQSDDAVRHRKYHRVSGSFRHYNPEKKEPYSIWVAEYYRGDPRLGVIIKTKEMRPSSAK